MKSQKRVLTEYGVFDKLLTYRCEGIGLIMSSCFTIKKLAEGVMLRSKKASNVFLNNFRRVFVNELLTMSGSNS